MNKKRIAFVLLLTWVIIFFALWLLNHFVLRYPIGDSFRADYRLIPPTLTEAKNITTEMSAEEVIEALGFPNYGDSNLSMINYSYDLQLGYIVTFTDYGVGPEILKISEPFTSTRWLVFPIIMLVIAVLEVSVYFIIKKIRTK